MHRIYGLGGSAFITKPTVYKDMLNAMDRLCGYWFGTVSLPVEAAGRNSLSVSGGNGEHPTHSSPEKV
jgi:hypothetical protein